MLCAIIIPLNTVYFAVSRGLDTLTLSFAVLSLYYVIMLLDRLQIREGGIWIDHSLLEWDRINSYSWEDGRPGHPSTTLWLQSASPFPLWYKSAIPIPVAHRDRVNQLLQAHVGQAGDATDY